MRRTGGVSPPGARLLAHFTTGSTMHKAALSTPIALLLQLLLLLLVLVLLAVQVDARECQETTVLAPKASAAVSTVRTERDLVHDTARGPHSSYAAHDAEIVGAVRGAMLCSKVESSTPPSSRPSSNVSAQAKPPLATAPSSKLLASSLSDVHAPPPVVAARGVNGLAASSNGRHKSGVNGVRPVESNVDSTFVPATASRASVSSSTPLASSSVHETAHDPPAKAAPTVVSSSSSHNASSTALSHYSERVPVKSTFLELSSAPTHVDDDSAAPAAASRPTSKATVSTGKAVDAAASATQTKADPSSAASSSSSSSASRLLFYSCLAVGVAGLVGAVLLYTTEHRTGAKQQQQQQQPRGSDGADAMPRATWAPRPSEVHVVMDGRNFAIL
ncbi:unnamed protein product [Hyaloperonospora brassicae]|uniref:RxLR effector candidate protein n=1 Tax=Hyaloperonospora brassicae TaxID=162125 RepID=A0AAV0UB78_HYABA|nr:unnamed protein product [Hyaloperonospora brassicae]